MIKKSFRTFLYLIATFLILFQSAYALNVVKLSPEYFPNSSIGRALSSADIYVGIPDLDPEIVANQKTLSVQQEDGTIVAVTQPISTGAGGVPLYLGSPVTLLVSGDYSLKVLDSYGAQIYYIPSTLYYTPPTTAYAQYWPDYTEVDQGAAGGGNSVYDILEEVGAATNATLYFAHNSGEATTTYTFTTNTTISANYNIAIEKGVVFDGAGTLTENGPFKPGRYKVFGDSITVLLGPGSTDEAYPEWWENNTTPGMTDMTDAINACATAAKTNLIKVKFGPGIYLVTESLDFTEANQTELAGKREGWIIEGSGQRSTIIKPVLTEAYPVMDLTGSAYAQVRDLSIYSYDDTGLQTCGILSAYSSTGGGHWQKFSNLMVRGYFNGGAAFASSCSDQFVLDNCHLYNLEGVAAAFFAPTIVATAYLTASIDSKFATITTQGNTKITTRDCAFYSTDSAATIFNGYADWEDTGSYWACLGTSTKALHFLGKSGGSSLTFSGMRMETDHADGNAIGIYIDAAGDGTLVGGTLQGQIEQDTNTSHAIQANTHIIHAMIINVVKTVTNTASLIDGDIANSVIMLSRPNNHNITSYTASSGGNTIYSVGDLLTTNWINVRSEIKYGARTYNSTEQGNRYSSIGSSDSFGREFGGIMYQAMNSDSSGAADDVLFTYEIPAFTTPTLDIDKSVIRIKCFGTTAANANAKDIRLYGKWYNDSTTTTNDYLLVQNDVTGSPNAGAWEINSTIQGLFESFSSMIVNAVPQTSDTQKFHDGEYFEYGVDTLTIEVRTSAALNDVYGNGFIITF